MLNNTESRLLWQRVIETSPDGHPLLHVSAAAEQAKLAYDQLVAANIDLNSLADNEDPDVQVFYRWAKAYQRACVEIGIDPNHVIQEEISRSSPSSRKTTTEPNIYLNACSDAQDEMMNMLKWAWETRKKYPAARIGCVVIDPLKIQEKLLLRWQLVSGAKARLKFEKNDSLLNQSVVNHLIMLLRYAFEDIDLYHVSILIRSPFLMGSDIEKFERVQFDMAMRNFEQRVLPIELLLKNAKNTCPQLAEIFTLCASHRDDKSVRVASEWAQLFNKIISQSFSTFASLESDSASGVERPGTQEACTLSSSPLESNSKISPLYNLLSQCLLQLAALDKIYSEITREKALNLLTQICGDSYLESETWDEDEVPNIQILSLLDASAQAFDYLWLANMTADALPIAPQPNPFLPLKLQQQCNLPQSSADTALIFCRELLQKVLYSAGEVVCSFAKLLDDAPQMITPLLAVYDMRCFDVDSRACGCEDVPNTVVSPSFPRMRESTYKRKYIPLKPNEPTTGGSYLLQLQANCPFQAFATIRLNAADMPELQSGLSAKDRGILLHSILEIFWKNNMKGDILNVDNQYEIQEQVEQIVAQQIELYLNEHPECAPWLTRSEHDRLARMIMKWLSLESERTPFKVIAIEKASRVKIGPLDLRLRVDRIDELHDGKKVIIDYKTGQVSLADWFGARMLAPQLPLYAICSDDSSISGICFAQIKPERVQFKGVGQEKNLVPGMIASKQPWQDLLRTWQADLIELATQFVEGDTSVDPLVGEATCASCGLQSLCRVNENG